MTPGAGEKGRIPGEIDTDLRIESNAPVQVGKGRLTKLLRTSVSIVSKAPDFESMANVLRTNFFA
jgi:hypothetical protein